MKPTNMSKAAAGLQKARVAVELKRGRARRSPRCRPLWTLRHENRHEADAASAARPFTDARRRLPDLAGFAGADATPLLGVANKVSANRDVGAQKAAANN